MNNSNVHLLMRLKCCGLNELLVKRCCQSAKVRLLMQDIHSYHGYQSKRVLSLCIMCQV